MHQEKLYWLWIAINTAHNSTFYDVIELELLEAGFIVEYDNGQLSAASYMDYLYTAYEHTGLSWLVS